mmetsp:Transcript_13597/g.25541  ORF Transcript_13597/g.25541 Transcript_13597/m.25541 type:complete len:776 (-) Transcript_13597:75-2402(-)
MTTFHILFLIFLALIQISHHVPAFTIGSSYSNNLTFFSVSSTTSTIMTMSTNKLSTSSFTRKNSNNNNNKKSSMKNDTNKKGYQFRSSGIKTKRIKPPQWEKEGDQLFIPQRDRDNMVLLSGKNIHDHDNLSLDDFLRQEMFQEEQDDRNDKSNNHGEKYTSNGDGNKSPNNSPPPPPPRTNNHLFWGDMSVGPILAPRLHTMLGPSPTAIQSQAFAILHKATQAKYRAAIIASPTGTGKTLAYLIPLMLVHSSSGSVGGGGQGKEKNHSIGKIWIVAPTVELLKQIQRVVGQLQGEQEQQSIFETKGSGDGSSSSYTGSTGGMYIVNQYYPLEKDNDPKMSSNNVVVQKTTTTIEEEILNSQASIIGGTPKALLRMISDWEKMNPTSTTRSSQSQWRKLLMDQLTTIVVEESDQLFKTELVARGSRASREDCPAMELLEKLQQRYGWGSGGRTMRMASDRLTRTNHKGGKKTPMELVCVSATVGRTLRRQIMEITKAPSMDKAAVLITADDRTKKDQRTRQRSLLPDTIEHCYAVYERGEDTQEGESVVDAICQAMKLQSPGRTLIFPGKLGVVKMVQALQKRNLHNVITLRDEVHWDESAEENVMRNENDYDWEIIPIYVVGEKFGRGLDIANVSYVFLAGPPTSAAAYTHLAGRTGRGKYRGRAITMLQGMEEANRLVSLSHTLGLTFVPLETSSKADNTVGTHDVTETCHDELVSTLETDDTVEGEQDVAKESVGYNDMSVSELKDLLRDKGLKVSGRKNELIERLKDNNL